MALMLAAPVVVFPLLFVPALVEFAMLAVCVVLPLAVGGLVIDDIAAAAGERGSHDGGEEYQGKPGKSGGKAARPTSSTIA